MYAVVRLAGKQIIVKPDTIVDVPLLDAEAGTVIRCDEVLLYADGKNVRVGRPSVEGVSVIGEILEHRKEDKITIYKMRKRKAYRRKQGHRQGVTRIKIREITA